jgi:[ribosomal protein S5]-alanine N-acetyltransferase
MEAVMSAQTMRPQFETNRLTLRRMGAQDCAAVVDLLNDWAVASMLGRVPHPYAPDDFHAWQSGHDAAWAAGKDFPYAICTAQDGVIGCIGIDGDRKTATTYEIGYWLGQAYWGQGYATEAGAALLAWARADIAPSGFTSRHFVENARSGHVLEKLGFSYIGVVKPSPCKARGHEVAARLMELTFPTWEERP